MATRTIYHELARRHLFFSPFITRSRSLAPRHSFHAIYSFLGLPFLVFFGLFLVSKHSSQKALHSFAIPRNTIQP